jgi:hypothetical protein
MERKKIHFLWTTNMQHSEREGGREGGREGDVPFQLTSHILGAAHGADIDEVLPAPVLVAPMLLVGMVGVQEGEVIAVHVRELKEEGREGGREGGRDG